MVTTGSIKKAAKAALKGNWCNAIIVCAVMVTLYYLCALSADCVEVAFGALTSRIVFYGLLFFLFAPLLLGVVRYFWRLLFEVGDNPVCIFYYYSEKKLYRRALQVTFALCIRAVLFGCFVFLPAWITGLLSSSGFYDFFHIAIPIWSVNLGYFTVFFETLAKIFLFFFLLRYFTLPFLAVADGEMEIGEAVHRCKAFSKVASWDPFVLIVSFLGWLLLCMLAVPAVFILPYFITALTIRFRLMIEAYNAEADRREAASFPAFDAT